MREMAVLMRTFPRKEAQGLQVLPAELRDCWEGLAAPQGLQSRASAFLCFYLIEKQGDFGIRFHLERKAESALCLKK